MSSISEKRNNIRKSYLDELIKYATFDRSSYSSDPLYELIVITDDHLVNAKMVKDETVISECKVKLKKGELALLEQRNDNRYIVLPLGLGRVEIDYIELGEVVQEVNYINLGYISEL